MNLFLTELPYNQIIFFVIICDKKKVKGLVWEVIPGCDLFSWLKVDESNQTLKYDTYVTLITKFD